MTLSGNSNIERLPGSFETHLRREIPTGAFAGGQVEFEYAPAGWPKKDGSPRLQDHRAYWWTGPDDEKRTRMVSSTTWGDAVHPKSLQWFGEKHGVYGAAEIVRRGLWNFLDEEDEDDLYELVKSHRLGVDAARDRAATRGIDVHTILENYALRSEFPNPSDHLPEMHGYIQAAARWLQFADPEPLEVEQLVCSPEDGYAGRIDLIAKINGLRTIVDFKSQERGQVFRAAHFQVASYRRADHKMGSRWADRCVIVVLSPDGVFREADCLVTDLELTDALRFYRAAKRVDADCEKANRIERKAREAA